MLETKDKEHKTDITDMEELFEKKLNKGKRFIKLNLIVKQKNMKMR